MKSLFTVALFFAASAGLTAEPVVTKVFLPPRLHEGNTGIKPLQPIDSAAWIWHPAFANLSNAAHAEFFSADWHEPVLLRFRKSFAATEAPLRLHVSADERFELFLDGRRIARGPDRSDVEHWSYATYGHPPRAGQAQAGGPCLEHRPLRAGSAAFLARRFHSQG